MMRTALVLAVAAAALAAGQADAHARLLRASPRVGATVAASPAELRLWFSESIVRTDSSVTLTGPAGRVALGPLGLDPKDHRVVVAPLPAPLAPGAYRVDWRMTSDDTHNTDGDFTFRVKP